MSGFLVQNFQLWEFFSPKKEGFFELSKPVSDVPSGLFSHSDEKPKRKNLFFGDLAKISIFEVAKNGGLQLFDPSVSPTFMFVRKWNLHVIERPK
jgi:hypothetical protein